MNEKTRKNEKKNLGRFGLVVNMRPRFENLVHGTSKIEGRVVVSGWGLT
jgi:hypothetical protein